MSERDHGKESDRESERVSNRERRRERERGWPCISRRWAAHSKADSSSPVSAGGSVSLPAPVCLSAQQRSGSTLVQREQGQVCECLGFSVCVCEGRKCVSVTVYRAACSFL